PFLFRRNWSRANPKSKEHFSLVSAEALRGGGEASLAARGQKLGELEREIFARSLDLAEKVFRRLLTTIYNRLIG
ncbi:MAG: hypothetical protein CO139_00400, partial [Candidatus Moranbacteria bacterium CG_4_9_14_3_um_filter_36_9]